MPTLLGLLAPLCLLQSVEYRSPAGVEYRAQRDTGAIARAESALAADPRNVDRIIALGVAQSGVRQYKEAIATFTHGLTIAPNNPLLYRWRGHRYLSTRQFDKAMDDLTRGARLDSTIYGIWYHLGIVRFVRRDFAGAAAAFTRALPIAPDSAERSGATDWLWMSLSRAGRGAEAHALLDRHPDTPPGGNAYTQRLRLYRGEVSPDSVFTPADTSDIQIATLSYGIGNWYLVRVSADQIPVADAVAQCRDLDVAGIGRREDGIRGDLATIQAQPLRVGVAAGRRVGVAIEQRMRFRATSGTRQRHPQPVGCSRALGGVRRDGQRPGERGRGARKIAAHEAHDAEVIPDAVDRAVEARAAGEVVHRLVELPRRQVAMPTPAIQQRVVRCDREPVREGRDRFLILAHARLGDAQCDDAIDVARIGGERALGPRNRAGVTLGAILDPRR